MNLRSLFEIDVTVSGYKGFAGHGSSSTIRHEKDKQFFLMVRYEIRTHNKEQIKNIRDFRG